MTKLYPLKFKPIIKEKIWGGSVLTSEYGKKPGAGLLIGESWEISAVGNNLSVVSNGFLEGNNLTEIIEVYMDDLTGEHVYEQFGNEFPLLIKFIEASSDLSVQVHPDDNMAMEKHGTRGKTEMWYILEAEQGSRIYSGFRHPSSADAVRKALADGSLPGLLNIDYPQKGDVFFTPAGRIHAIGGGITLVEIQETSDITYRLYDWNRKDSNGNSRELHIEEALSAIDYNATGSAIIRKTPLTDATVNLVDCEYFVTGIIKLEQSLRKNYGMTDSFIIYICTQGSFSISWEGGRETAIKGETILLPAAIDNVILTGEPKADILEIFIKNIENGLS